MGYQVKIYHHCDDIQKGDVVRSLMNSNPYYRLLNVDERSSLSKGMVDSTEDWKELIEGTDGNGRNTQFMSLFGFPVEPYKDDCILTCSDLTRLANILSTLYNEEELELADKVLEIMYYLRNRSSSSVKLVVEV